MKKAIYLFIFVSILVSCQKRNSLMYQLVRIDSIANNKGDEKALLMLDEIIPETISEEECLAYYWLLKTRTDIRLNHNIKSISPIDIAIGYYKKSLDKEKLAKAYGYKAHILESHGNLKEALLALKKAESFVSQDASEVSLANHIYYSLGSINRKSKELDLALRYNKMALTSAYKLNNPYNIAFALMAIYATYNDMGESDSASYYMRKIMVMVENVPEKERSSFYSNIGLFLMEREDSLAEMYFEKANNITPNAYAYKGLSRLFYFRGEKDKAHEMWKKALQTDNMYMKAEVLQTIYECQYTEGKFKSACGTAMKLANLKDSIARKEKANDIRGMQERYEQDQTRINEKLKYQTVLSFILTILLLVSAIAIYFYKRNKKERWKLHEIQLTMECYHSQLKMIEAEGKTDTKVVEKLTKKISELQSRQNAQLQNGREHFEEITAGGTTLRWSRSDFEDCIEYYRTIDAAFIVHMEQDYRHLSAKYIFFALMEHLGRTNEELQYIMAVSQSTVRSYRSRINNRVL